MDLNLYLGLPRFSRRLRRVDLGSDLALGSPFRAASSREESGDSAADMPRTSEPQTGYPHAPYSPSSAAIVPPPDRPLVPSDHRPPFVTRAGDDPVQGYSPHCPSYQLLAPSYAPITPPAVLSSSRVTEAPYGMSYIPAHPSDRDSAQAFPGNGDRTSHLLSSYGSPSADAGLGDEPLVAGEGGGGGTSHVRYSPSYIPLSAIPEDHDDVTFNPYQPIVVGSAEIFEGDDGRPLHQDFLEPEVRFRRLIELQRRSQRSRPYQLSYPYGIGPPDYDLVREMSSDESAENSRKNSAGEKGIGGEGLEEKEEEKDACAVNFECNICLDLAEEPVVTSCGHLFCWPCLYQWLHLHCSHSECPVCKGEVIEATITPVYGRGSSGSMSQKGRRDGGDSGLKIPPRPRARRVESWRQRIRRPVSRRLTMGISNTWRRVLGEELPVADAADRDVEASLQETINSAHRRVATRLRARRPARMEDSSENGSSGIIHPLPLRSSALSRQIEGNSSSIIGRLSSSARFSFGGLSGRSANLSRILGSLSAESGSHSGASASPGNPQNADDLVLRHPTGSTQQGMDQASASSTMAVIQGDGVSVDLAAAANSAGSSRPLRSRGRSSSSLDVDGCAQHGRKRRRMN